MFTDDAEAVENAVKIARAAATGRPGAIAFTGAVHGRTMTAMNPTGTSSPRKNAFGPPLPNIRRVPFPGDEQSVSVEESLRHFAVMFKAAVDPAQVAALIIERARGEGGFNIAPAEPMRNLREACDTMILIADEAQAGYGRTETMFAMQHYDLEPDLVCSATSLAGGLRLSAKVLARAHRDGLILRSCGTEAGTIRILAPPTTEDAVRDEGLGILAGASMN